MPSRVHIRMPLFSRPICRFFPVDFFEDRVVRPGANGAIATEIKKRIEPNES